MAALEECSFLIHDTHADAQDRSAEIATGNGCDGELTKYWHQQQELTDGRSVLVIQPDGPYSTQDLTPEEIAALVPWSEIEPYWPKPPEMGAPPPPAVHKPAPAKKKKEVKRGRHRH